jgi:hypothetical protein
MVGIFGIAIALVSLAISGTTLWITLLRRGRIAMTKPTIVFFGFDSVPRITPKVFLRTLLYSTSARGQVIEGMYVKLRQGGDEQLFSFWGYGETNKLTAGGGLYVGQAGVAANHHFVRSPSQPPYEFGAGDYNLRVFARTVGKANPAELAQINLRLTEQQAGMLMQRRGILFERAPDAQEYIGHVDERPT